MDQPQPMPESKPAIVRPWLLIVFLIVILAGGGYLGYYYWTKSKTETPTTNNTATDATADWKTYTDTTNNFSIKYPTTWEYKSHNGIIEFREIGKTYNIEGSDIYAVGVTVSENNNQTLQDIANKRKTAITVGTVDVKDVTFGGQSAIQMSDYLQIETLTVKNQKEYAIFKPILGTMDDQVLKVYSQMVSTFQFTTPISTADWKTYNDANLGISLKYPSNWEVAPLEGMRPGFSLTNPQTKTKVSSGATGIPTFDISIMQLNSTLGGAANFSDLQKTDSTIVKIGETTVGGASATEATRGGMTTSFMIYASHNNKFVEINFAQRASKNQLSDTEKQILNSIQFN